MRLLPTASECLQHGHARHKPLAVDLSGEQFSVQNRAIGVDDLKVAREAFLIAQLGETLRLTVGTPTQNDLMLRSLA